MQRERFGLSPREQQILARVAQGKNSREIGEELNLKPLTISLRLGQLRKKLGARSKHELLRHPDVYMLEGFAESV